MFGALVSSLRPHQWTKNLFVAAPLLFAKHLTNLPLLGRSLLAVFAFCLLSGAVYLINDLFDLEHDRAHPIKRLRPMASGRLPLPVAQTAAALLILASLGLTALLGLPCFACAAGYLIVNLAYSLHLKHMPFVDVLSIAAGFLLRVLPGALALAVVASPWLLICTFVLACLLGFGKRAHELANAGDTQRARARRPVLARYRLVSLITLLWVLAAATCVSYGLYTLSAHTRSFFGTSALVWTVPFVVLGVLRFLQLVRRHTRADSPTDAMLGDWPFLLNGALWGLATALIIYGL